MLLIPEFHAYHSASVTGNLLRWPSVSSAFLAHPRDILVWLPPEYHEAQRRRFPVLYLHDGQNKFDPATSYSGVDWDVDGIATRLIQEGEIEPMIMVAVYNSPDRLQEYNPLSEGDAYGRFIVEELMPAINQEFRTEGGRRNALMGSSMAGLISLALLWWYSDHFYAAASLSPSLWVLWRAGGPRTWLTRQPLPKSPVRLYIDHGTIGYEARGAQAAKQVVEYLSSLGYAPGSTRYWVAEGGEHNEASWQARVAEPLRFLFPLR